MRVVLYICIAISAAIAALGVLYLTADKIRFESREAGKPWQQHPMVRLCSVCAIGGIGPFAVASLFSLLFVRLGVPPARMLAWKIGNLLIVLGLLLPRGPADGFQRRLPARTAHMLSKLIAVEQFFQRRLHAWWLPHVIFALVCMPYRAVRFQTPDDNVPDC